MAYAEKESEVAVRWSGFEDSESGIDQFTVTLWYKGYCSSVTDETDYSSIQTVELDGNLFSYTFTNLSLAVSTVNVLKFQTLFSDQFTVTLWYKGFCSSVTDKTDYSPIQTVVLDGSLFSFTFTNLSLAVSTVNVLKFRTLYSFCSQIKSWFAELEFIKCLSE